MDSSIQDVVEGSSPSGVTWNPPIVGVVSLITPICSGIELFKTMSLFNLGATVIEISQIEETHSPYRWGE